MLSENGDENVGKKLVLLMKNPLSERTAGKCLFGSGNIYNKVCKREAAAGMDIAELEVSKSSVFKVLRYINLA